MELGNVVDCLLNPAHPDNGGKAAFFQSLGFRRENGVEFQAALLELAIVSDDGQKFGLAAWGQVYSRRTT